MREKCVFFFFFSPLCFLSLKVSSFPVRTEVVLGMMHFHLMWACAWPLVLPKVLPQCKYLGGQHSVLTKSSQSDTINSFSDMWVFMKKGEFAWKGKHGYDLLLQSILPHKKCQESHLNFQNGIAGFHYCFF